MSDDTWTSVSRTVTRGIRFGILAVLVVGIRRRNAGAVVNAVVGLVGTYLPGAIEARYDVTFRPWQRVYATSAMLTHAIGMLGPYDDVWWWDHVTHTHSSTILGGLVYALARRRGRDPRRSVLTAVIGGGSLWEAMEYAIHALADRVGLEPVLIRYGNRDTVLDMCFNVLGACLVLAFGEDLLDNFTPE